MVRGSKVGRRGLYPNDVMAITKKRFLPPRNMAGIRPRARLAQKGKRKCTGRETGRGGRMGQNEMAMNTAARHLLRHS
jgi:hypothetical protein